MPDALVLYAVALLAPPALGARRHSAEAGRFAVGKVRKKICPTNAQGLARLGMGHATAVKNTSPCSRHIPLGYRGNSAYEHTSRHCDRAAHGIFAHNGVYKTPSIGGRMVCVHGATASGASSILSQSPHLTRSGHKAEMFHVKHFARKAS